MNVEVLRGLDCPGDPLAQQQVVQYFEQLKESVDGWKICASALTSGNLNNSDHAKFFCLQVIEHFLKTRYNQSSEIEKQNMKALLHSLIQMQSVRGKDKSFILNKVAQLFALAFTSDYPDQWPSFFDDIQQLFSLGEIVVDLYLRTLMAIDSEVVDREIVHTPEETVRNTRLKDAMRVRSVPRMVDSWYHIITTLKETCPQIVCSCLDVIGAYVSWIEISLIANDKFVGVLLQFMSMPLLRESACDCIHEIISKGMDPVAKTALIESFMSVLQEAGTFNLKEEEDGDFLAKISKLVNGVGLNLIAAWQKLAKAGDAENAKVSLDAIETKIPLMLKLLANEDDDVSSAVAKFAHDYLSLLKLIRLISNKQKENVKALLLVVIQKMKYDDSYSFDQEGEDEAMFQEYRKELKVILNNMGVLDPDLLLSATQTLVTNTLQQWQSLPFQDVEVSIFMMYLLAESLPNSISQQFSSSQAKTSPLQQMMKMMVDSKVSCHQHSAVGLQFFETLVRYDKYFAAEPQQIAPVLMAFLDEHGLKNKSGHVSSRTAYLFSRFVKSINKAHLQDYIEEILKRVHGLLAINSPDNGVQHGLSGDDQLFLYETAGVLIVSSQFPPQKKQSLMKHLLAPIVTKFDGLLQHLVRETDEAKQLAYAQCLSQAMAFASRTSKGFSSSQTMKSCGCVEAFTETLQVFLHALNAPVHRQLLHAGVRQFLHRMVVCLEDEVLPYVPMAMEHLLKNADAKELYDFIPLINQVVGKFKKHIVPFLQEVFMPIVTTIFQVLQAPSDERDQVAATDKKLLHRGYFSFIANLVNHNVTQVLGGQDSQNLQEVLMTIIHGAVELADPQAQKTCFGVLKKLVEVWGGEDGVPGFQDFVYKNILPASFMAPMKPTFDLNDAQTVLALNEASGCLKAIYEKRGDETIQYLQSQYLPTLNASAPLIQEFCMALKGDAKMFRNYFKMFFARGRS